MDSEKDLVPAKDIPIFTKVLLLLVGVAVIYVFFGCGTKTDKNLARANTDESANKSPYSNSANSMTNSTSSNSASNTATTNLAINRGTLSESLKNRLMDDNEELLTDDDWAGDAWLDVSIGLFYKNDDEFSKDAVCDVTEEILRSANKKMTDVSERRLRNNINHNTKGRICISEMLTATLDTKPINPIP